MPPLPDKEDAVAAKTTSLIGTALASLLAAMVTISLAISVNAQPADSEAQRTTRGYDKVHEITLNGTIQEVVREAPAGTPVGVHVMVAGPDGLVDAHLGPYLTNDTLEAMQAGTPVQIVGAMETLQGEPVLLARQVIFSGRLVTVRSVNGFLVRTHALRAHSGGFAAQKTQSNGGAR